MSTAATSGAVGGAIAAAEAKRKREEEEEKMTNYNNDDLEGWEFKIVRSNFGRFKNYDTVKKTCEEEASSGWELVEKFDDCRLRFKRKTSHRAQDAHRQIDPYRTSSSRPGGAIKLATIGAIILGLGLVAAFLSLIIYFN